MKLSEQWIKDELRKIEGKKKRYSTARDKIHKKLRKITSTREIEFKKVLALLQHGLGSFRRIVENYCNPLEPVWDDGDFQA